MPVQPPDFLGSPFWAAENRRLVAILRPLLQEAAELGVGIAEEDLLQFEVGFDNALANAEAADWARRHTDALLIQLGTTTRRQVDSIIANWFTTPGGLVGEFIEVPGMTLGDLSTALERVLGYNRSRAQMIARTEGTRATAEGREASRVAAGLPKTLYKAPAHVRCRCGDSEDLLADGTWVTIWQTARDEVVCFVKGTLVETISGAIPIDMVKPKTMVLTRIGHRPVIATSRRLYSDGMVTITHEGGSLTCTSEHPIWTSEQGWLQASDLNVGQSLQMVGDEVSKIVSVKHFGVSDPQNFPAMLFKKFVLSLISFSGIPMPINPINFKSYAQIREKEVNSEFPYSCFLNVWNVQLLKNLPNFLLRKCFAFVQKVAFAAAKSCLFFSARKDLKLLTANKASFDNCVCLSIRGRTSAAAEKFGCRFAWQNSKFFSTEEASVDVGWSSAFLRAKMAVVAWRGILKELATTFTSLVFGVRQPAFAGANSVSVGDRFVDPKLFPTDRANFDDRNVAFSTFQGAIAPIVFDLSESSVDQLSTSWTSDFFSSLCGLMIACRRTKGLLTCNLTATYECLTALCASVFKRHATPLLTRMIQLYHNLFAKTSIMVYNLEVEDDPTFYADGVLVHNCVRPLDTPLGEMQGCRDLHGRVISEGPYFGMPIEDARAIAATRAEGQEQVTTEQATAELAGTLAEYEAWQAGRSTPVKFDPNQPRDERGRWQTQGMSTSAMRNFAKRYKEIEGNPKEIEKLSKKFMQEYGLSEKEVESIYEDMGKWVHEFNMGNHSFQNDINKQTKRAEVIDAWNQTVLAAEGITDLTLFRGVGAAQAQQMQDNREGNYTWIGVRRVSSWSTSHAIANEHASGGMGGGAVINGKFPASVSFASYLSFPAIFGTKYEGEHLLVAGKQEGYLRWLRLKGSKVVEE